MVNSAGAAPGVVDLAHFIAQMVDAHAEKAVAAAQRAFELVVDELAVGGPATEADHGYRGVLEGAVDGAVDHGLAAAADAAPERGALKAGRGVGQDVGRVEQRPDTGQVALVVDAEVGPARPRAP